MASVILYCDPLYRRGRQDASAGAEGYGPAVGAAGLAGACVGDEQRNMGWCRPRDEGR